MIHPDDIDGLIAAIQVHLEAGHVGFHGLLSPHQMNYRECYHQVCMLSAEWSNEGIAEFDNRYVRGLRELLNRLALEAPPGSVVYAVNTTFHGREANENHQPERMAA